MTTKIASALFAIVAACSGCATTTPALTKVGHEVSCVASDIASQIPAIIIEVGTDLAAPTSAASADLLTQLESSLVKSLGPRLATDTVVCAVKVSSESADARMASATGEQPNAAKIKANAAEYLRLRQVSFPGGPAGG